MVWTKWLRVLAHRIHIASLVHRKRRHVGGQLLHHLYGRQLRHRWGSLRLLVRFWSAHRNWLLLRNHLWRLYRRCLLLSLRRHSKRFDLFNIGRLRSESSPTSSKFDRRRDSPAKNTSLAVTPKFVLRISFVSGGIMIKRSHRVVHRAQGRRSSHPSLVVSAVVAGAIVVLASVSVAAVGSSGGFSGPTSSTKVEHTVPTGADHLLGRWITPRDESGAPIVATSGGAFDGLGSFNGVSCPTSNECGAVGGDGDLNAVASTSQDDGGTWTQGVLDQNEPELNAVDCESASICVAVGQGATVQSSDGGKTWTSSSIPTANTTLLGVSCPSSATCVSVGVSPSQNGPFSGQLLLSSDGGIAWSVPILPTNFWALGSVDCPTSSFCVAVGASIVVSNDGGKTWAARTVSGGTGVLRSVSCESATTCVAVGGNPAVSQGPGATGYEVVTTDGGARWEPTSMPSGSGTVNTVSCSSTACVAVGSAEDGYALRVLTTTSASTWSPDSSFGSPATAFSALSCYSSTSCVFVGQDGNQSVSVSTVGGVAVPVTPQVRTQKDQVR